MQRGAASQSGMDEGDAGAFVEEGEMLMEGGRKWARRGEREKESPTS